MPDIFQDSSRYFHISAFYALSLPYYHMEHHTHSSYEIMYITSGSCRVFCMDEEQDMEFPLKSGQFIFIARVSRTGLRSRTVSMLDPESGIFPHLRKKPGFSGPSSEKRSRIFPVLEFYCLLPGILLRHGFPEFRIQPERPSHLFTAQFRSDKGGRISLLSSVWPYAHRTCFLRPLQPEHPGKCLSEKSAPVY